MRLPSSIILCSFVIGTSASCLNQIIQQRKCISSCSSPISANIIGADILEEFRDQSRGFISLIIFISQCAQWPSLLFNNEHLLLKVRLTHIFSGQKADNLCKMFCNHHHTSSNWSATIIFFLRLPN